MLNPFKLSAEEFWLFVRVLCLAFLIVMFGIRWTQRARTTKAHKVLGLLVLGVMTMMLLVISFDNLHSYVLGPMFSVALGLWFGLDNWYFHNYQPAEEWLNDPNRQLGTFGLNTWLGRLLTKRELPDQSISRADWERSRALDPWRIVAILMSGLFVYALVFGFTRQMDKLALITKFSAQASKQAEQKTKQAVDTAVKQTATLFTTQLHSLSLSQQQLAQQVQTGTRTLTTMVGANGKKADVASKAAAKAAQAAALAARRGTPVIFVTPQPIMTLPTPRLDPDRVKPVKPAAKSVRGNRHAFEAQEQPVDTSIYARNFPN